MSSIRCSIARNSLFSDWNLTQNDREKMTFDVSGHYARPDLFRFERKYTDAK